MNINIQFKNVANSNDLLYNDNNTKKSKGMMAMKNVLAKLFKNSKIRIVFMVLGMMISTLYMGSLFLGQIFPQDPEIEKSWPEVEAMQKARGEMYDKMDQKELHKIQEETQKELLAEWEYANEQKNGY